MKQILNALVIVALTLCIGCLATPANLEKPIRSENSTEAAVMKNEYEELIKTNKVEMQPIELTESDNTDESPVIRVKVLDISKNEKTTDEDKLTLDQTSTTMENKSHNKENHKKEEEDHKSKDVTAEEITKQNEFWKDFEDDFSLLQDRLPDLTEEEFKELNKEDAIPWNFLKSLDVKSDITKHNPREVAQQTPVYITIPIVINTHSTLPISVTIGEQSVPLKLAGGDTKDPSKVAHKLMDYLEPPPRQTNRHRSNIRSKIYARNNNHKIQEFKYKAPK